MVSGAISPPRPPSGLFEPDERIAAYLSGFGYLQDGSLPLKTSDYRLELTLSHARFSLDDVNAARASRYPHGDRYDDRQACRRNSVSHPCLSRFLICGGSELQMHAAQPSAQHRPAHAHPPQNPQPSLVGPQPPQSWHPVAGCTHQWPQHDPSVGQSQLAGSQLESCRQAILLTDHPIADTTTGPRRTRQLARRDVLNGNSWSCKMTNRRSSRDPGEYRTGEGQVF